MEDFHDSGQFSLLLLTFAATYDIIENIFHLLENIFLLAFVSPPGFPPVSLAIPFQSPLLAAFATTFFWIAIYNKL